MFYERLYCMRLKADVQAHNDVKREKRILKE